ncbi:DUF3080 domain-containing protein [Shewanella mesophila]|uniref:DUF3080 family protein n=1 Tax=Shewanella mesophila TaxID=2864208 RepID=UPI001C65F70E|nr:DUF3080 family protein [Shewanella mesophila]QYJ86663.1 DUF3080 domain-containing protein [Shewanella mesophila]
MTAKTAALILIAAFLLCGCQPDRDADYVWHDYTKRLEAVLEVPFESTDFAPLILPKAAHQMPSRLNISILQSFKLNHCKLGELIANHNSSLGKVAPPSQRLIYHIRFIQLAPACIASLDDAALIATQRQGLAQKQQQALDVFIQMLTRDRSINKRLFIGYDSLTLDEMQYGRLEFESALTQLNGIKLQIITQDWQQIEIDDLEQTLAIFHRHPLLNQYLRSLSVSVFELRELNDYLFQHQARAACRPGHANQQQTILQNVFHKYYLAQTQAYLSQLNQLHYRLSQPMQQLFEGTIYQDYVNAHFADDDDALPAQLKRQMKHHVKWWKDFRQSCNIAIPGS